MLAPTNFLADDGYHVCIVEEASVLQWHGHLMHTRHPIAARL